MSLEKEVIRIYIVSDLYIIGKYRLCMTNKTTDDYVMLYRAFTCDDALTAGSGGARPVMHLATESLWTSNSIIAFKVSKPSSAPG